MKAAIYTRISQDQTGERLGVQRQLDDCMALAERLGWEVVEHFDDNDTSAYRAKKRRKGYEALLESMRDGGVQAVLCWHTDRLYRRLGDLERLIEIAEANRVDIRTVQGGDIDLSTSAGRMIARILGSVANAESEHKGERHRAANDQKAARGAWQTANRTFGYTMDGAPLEPEASAVRQAVAGVLAGKSIQGVARDWNAAGLKTTVKKGDWNGARVRRLLVNPRYAALKVHRGKVVGPGDWTPLITPDVHRSLVTLLSDPSRIKCTSFERKYLGSGLYRCGVCDDGTTMKAAMPGNKADGTPVRRSRAYVCRVRAHLVRAGDPLDDFVTAQILERMTRDEDASSLLGNQAVDVTALTVQRDALQAKLDDITRMFEDDDIGADQFAATSRSTRSKLAVIDQQLAEVTRTSPAAALIAAGNGAWTLWQSMTVTQRAEAVDEVAVVTVKPCPRGRRTFDHTYIDVTFRRDA